MVDYKVRYALLDSTTIFNCVGPDSLDILGITEEKKPRRHKIAEQRISARDEKDNFFKDLEKSILSDGIHNPILITAGTSYPIVLDLFPEEVKKNPKRILVCDFMGGSRLWIAQKHNMKIPCIISDFEEVFPDKPILETVEEIESYFKDPPTEIRFEDIGIRIRTTK